MYRGFCITKDVIHQVVSNYYITPDLKIAKRDILDELNGKAGAITDTIAAILKGNSMGVIDSEALQKACLPTKNDHYDVFISHSHNNEAEAKNLAVYLYQRYDVKCFVDGFVWWSCDEKILKPIDEIWSWHKTKKGSFSYEKRNFSTSHVHAMLSMALLEMIDKCECCIFIKPDKEYFISGIGDYTLSPWIYEEICMFNKVHKELNRNTRCTESFSAIDPKLKISYKLDLSNMPELKANHLTRNFPLEDYALATYKKSYKWLDYLYDNVI